MELIVETHLLQLPLPQKQHQVFQAHFMALFILLHAGNIQLAMAILV